MKISRRNRKAVKLSGGRGVRVRGRSAVGEVGKKRGERERRRGLNDHAYVTCCSKIRDDITSKEEEMGDPFTILWK